MLTILLGQNLEARAARLEKILSKERDSGSDVVFYTDVNFNKEEIIFATNSVSLFGKKNIFVLTGVYDNTETRVGLEEIIEHACESTDNFILCEKVILAPFIKKATKHGAVIENFDEAKNIKKETYNPFAFTDAYCEKKRSIAWALYTEGISTGIDPYELHSKIFWATKNMIIIKLAKSVDESGINPYVYAKTKKSAEKFTLEELEKNLITLTNLFHETIFSGANLETALESFVLRSLE
ncbi:MAG: hypothetical protein WCO65_02610 [bacterium]